MIIVTSFKQQHIIMLANRVTSLCKLGTRLMSTLVTLEYEVTKRFKYDWITLFPRESIQYHTLRVSIFFCYKCWIEWFERLGDSDIGLNEWYWLIQKVKIVSNMYKNGRVVIWWTCI